MTEINKNQESKDLLNVDDPKSIADFLQKPATKVAEFLAGILFSDSRDLKYSAGRLVQASIQWKLYSQLGKELNDYIQKGKIKNDFLDDDQKKQSLHEILKFIDEATPDKNRFRVVKTLFLKSLSDELSQGEQIISYQFMKLSTHLDSDALLILKAAYEVSNGNLSQAVNVNLETRAANQWLDTIATQIGHGIKSLVELHEEQLMKHKLISSRDGRDNSGIVRTRHFRLTDLGYASCEYVYNA